MPQFSFIHSFHFLMDFSFSLLNQDGTTPLMQAANYGSSEQIVQLLKLEADISAMDNVLPSFFLLPSSFFHFLLFSLSFFHFFPFNDWIVTMSPSRKMRSKQPTMDCCFGLCDCFIFGFSLFFFSFPFVFSLHPGWPNCIDVQFGKHHRPISVRDALANEG